MINLRNGDTLPSVALIQAMLNATSDGAILDVDGIFGNNTRNRVKAFQEFNNIVGTGILDEQTWSCLNSRFRQQYQIRDIVDMSDEAILSIARDRLSELGQVPITLQNTSGGVYRIVSELSRAGISNQNLYILRLQAHGNSGSIAVSYGTGCHVYYGMINQEFNNDWQACGMARQNASQAQLDSVSDVISRSSLSSSALLLPDVRSALAPLRNMFSPYGVIELHGCQVGRGQRGEQFLQDLSNFLGVPAVASKAKQYAERPIRFRGRKVVKYPSGYSARSWADSRPVLQGVSNLMS
ncbi:peptidoglycan-binding protein [Hyunsoonleella rubra]|uniref:Peptidoglycan-binding protein n=1 Tax=Hyunsoonleella rubra TaxID=1737062 RepID=A0ABW5TE07_9FLAO